PAFEDDAPLLPSALLADVPQAPAPPVWDPPALARSEFDARPGLVVAIDGALPPLRSGERAPGGARLLELQAACPFRAGAELRLGARPLEEPALGLDAATRGVLVHDLFAAVWGEVRTSAQMQELPPGERVARVRAAIATGLAPLRRDANGVLARLLDIEAQWLERQALQLLDADLARPPFEVEHVETAYELTLGGLSLDLRVDRVDRLADGSCAVIDYKTGGNAQPRNWLDERPQLPQLPLYVEALGAQQVSAVVFGRVRAGETGFAGLARDPASFPGCKAPPREYANWDELLAAWHRRLETLAREFATGEARLAPNPSQACRYCHLPSLCRIGEARMAGDDEGAGDE
ncbi:MAG TPA: PD-(D/E)XK nuclease family protein, partial [Steroidobacteraceae bacterium]